MHQQKIRQIPNNQQSEECDVKLPHVDLAFKQGGITATVQVLLEFSTQPTSQLPPPSQPAARVLHGYLRTAQSARCPYKSLWACCARIVYALARLRSEAMRSEPACKETIHRIPPRGRK